MVTSNKNDLKKQIYLKSITTFFFVSILFILSSTCFSQDRFPGKTWMQFAKPQLAGWSNEKLKGAKAFADSIGSAAFMLIYDGAVVTTWGDIERRYMCHSVRKTSSLLLRNRLKFSICSKHAPEFITLRLMKQLG